MTVCEGYGTAEFLRYQEFRRDCDKAAQSGDVESFKKIDKQSRISPMDYAIPASYLSDAIQAGHFEMAHYLLNVVPLYKRDVGINPETGCKEHVLHLIARLKKDETDLEKISHYEALEEAAKEVIVAEASPTWRPQGAWLSDTLKQVKAALGLGRPGQ